MFHKGPRHGFSLHFAFAARIPLTWRPPAFLFVLVLKLVIDKLFIDFLLVLDLHLLNFGFLHFPFRLLLRTLGLESFDSESLLAITGHRYDFSRLGVLALENTDWWRRNHVDESSLLDVLSNQWPTFVL